MEAIHIVEESKEFTIDNPATGEEVSRYPLMDKRAVDNAVRRARETAPEWAKTSFKERKRIFKKAASILAENARHYADVVSNETGKTRLDALLADVFPVADLLKFYGKNAKKFLKPVQVGGSILMPGRKGYYTFEPKGVIGVISPWNYPFTLSAGPAIAAIAAGNTVVLKPSSQTIGSGTIIREILEKAGLPEGVLEVVTGSGSVTGQALIEHDKIDMLFFTGSTAIGRKVNVAAAERLIPTVMELGGKDVAIVTKNADLDRAAHAVTWGSFTNSGQTCIGVETVLVDRAVYEPFLEKVTAITSSLRSGKKAGEIGSMTMSSQLEIVEDQVEDARAKGAKIIIGGKRDPDQVGLFYPPTLIANTSPDMKVRHEETFGPLLPIVPYDDIHDAIKLANSSVYGLSGSVFTRDMEEGRWIAKRLNTGSININDTLITYALPGLPFGGNKESGVGRYHGKMGIRAFTNIKSITEFSWNLKKEPYWYPLPEESEEAALAALPALFSSSPLKRFSSFLKLASTIRRIIKKEKGS